jgi:phage/plasmid primase-like uncharacterized protein
MRIDTSTVQREFVEAMRRRNLALSGSLIADGKSHRCDATNKENGHGKNDGLYVLHLDNIPAGGFRNFTDGQGWQNWCSKSKHYHLTDAERRDLDRKIEAAKAEAEAEQRLRWEEAREEANEDWDKAGVASTRHPYLIRKRIRPHGLRQLHGILLVPVRDRDDKLHSLQRIYRDGRKYFLTGGRTRGCFHLIDDCVTDKTTIVVCEGFATGATIHEATGCMVIVAFNASNLVAVANTVRDMYPNKRIVIAADDDWKTEGNPGLTRAKEAAAKVDGFVAVPDFGDDRRDNETDFNDMACAFTPDEVKRAIDDAAGVDPDEAAACRGTCGPQPQRSRRSADDGQGGGGRRWPVRTDSPQLVSGASHWQVRCLSLACRPRQAARVSHGAVRTAALGPYRQVSDVFNWARSWLRPREGLPIHRARSCGDDTIGKTGKVLFKNPPRRR